MQQPFINAIAYYLPEHKLTNARLHQEHPEWSVDKISLKIGIEERPIAAPDEYASDMGVKAAEKLFADTGFDRSKVDFLLFCTQSPDYFLPTTACIVQDRLGLPKSCGALDFNLGCSGYVYGLGLAKGLLLSGQAKNVLLITSETYSKYIHNDDKGNKSLFGDAAAATLISSDLADKTGRLVGMIGNFAYGTDGAGAEHLIVRNGAARHRLQNSTGEVGDAGNYLHMDGKAIFDFTAFAIPVLIDDVLARNNSSREDIGLYVFHQANKFMLETVRKRCNIPADQFFIFLAKCANTVSSTIPIALCEALNQGRVEQDTKVLLAGFGVGLSMGGTLLNFSA